MDYLRDALKFLELSIICLVRLFDPTYKSYLFQQQISQLYEKHYYQVWLRIFDIWILPFILINRWLYPLS